MKKIKQKDNGITLIALVITIIVLLILAGVSISMLTGENGILTQAQSADETTKRAAAEEAVDLMLNEYQIAKAIQNKSLETFLTEKQTAGQISNLTKNADGTYSFEKDGYTMIVTSAGKRLEEGEIAKVEPENPEDWEFDAETGIIKLKIGGSYTANNKYSTLVVPNYYNGQQVKAINANSYQEIGNTSKIQIDKIVISDGIEEVGRGTFGYTSVKELYLSKTLKKISEYAFDANYIETLVIPNTVETIENHAFGYSNSYELETLTIPQSVIDTGVSNVFGTGIATSLKTLNIAEGATNIPASAFKDYTSLETVNIANTVESIGNYAFQGCTGLTDLEIGNTAPDIGQYALERTNAEFEIPSQMTKIGNRAFGYCFGLKNVVIPNTVTEIEDYAFSGCSNLETIAIPNSVEKVGGYVFNSCPSTLVINCETTLSEGQTVPDGWNSSWASGISADKINWGVSISE